VNGKMGKLMDLEFILGVTETNMRVNGRLV